MSCLMVYVLTVDYDGDTDVTLHESLRGALILAVSYLQDWGYEDHDEHAIDDIKQLLAIDRDQWAREETEALIARTRGAKGFLTITEQGVRP